MGALDINFFPATCNSRFYFGVRAVLTINSNYFWLKYSSADVLSYLHTLTSLLRVKIQEGKLNYFHTVMRKIVRRDGKRESCPRPPVTPPQHHQYWMTQVFANFN